MYCDGESTTCMDVGLIAFKDKSTGSDGLPAELLFTYVHLFTFFGGEGVFCIALYCCWELQY